MPDKTDEVPDPGPSTKDRAKGGGVRKLHYIVHLDTETEQVIKIEELDEATNTTREMPLPLFLADEESELAEESAECGETELVFDLPHEQPSQPQPVYGYPHGYYGYPTYWPMVPPPFMAPTPCVMPPSSATPAPCVVPCGLIPLPCVASSGVPTASVPFSTPKADFPPSTPKAVLTFSTPKAEFVPSTPKAELTLSTPKAESVPSTPKAEVPPSTPKATSALRRGTKRRKSVGPCISFRFKPE